jgi:tRNA modification GTPase
VRRSEAAIEQADLLLIVLDASTPLSVDDRRLLDRHLANRDKTRVVILNKTDLPSRLDKPITAPDEHSAVVHLSAKTGEGLDELRDRIRTLFVRPDFEVRETALVTYLRHQAALQRALEALTAGLASVEIAAAGELIAMDLRAAIDALGEITGAVSTDDILDRIFRDFCIGK